MTARELLARATRQLQAAACPTARLDAELLLMHAWNMGRTGLIMRLPEQVPAAVEEAFHTLIQRRQRREPVAYITGQREFWSREFTVTPDVLIPRPETEHLIEELLQLYPAPAQPWHFCDIGTGSGCIAVTLACEYPQAHLVATDISPAALAVAQENAERYGVASRIDFRCGDMFTALKQGDAPFDAILSNPPYVAETEMAELEPELAHEPHGALSDRRDGLHYLSLLLDGAARHLHPGGHLLLETGLCGLPPSPKHMSLLHRYRDLAGHLRGGVYKAAI